MPTDELRVIAHWTVRRERRYRVEGCLGVREAPGKPRGRSQEVVLQRRRLPTLRDETPRWATVAALGVVDEQEVAFRGI